jgi:hypothetical protein
MGNHFNQFCIFIRSSAKKLQIANRFKTIDQLLLKQSMTLAELVGAHVTTNSTACYGYSSSQSSLKLKPHSCLQMHGPCQMQRNGHQTDIKWTPNGSTSYDPTTSSLKFSNLIEPYPKS